MGSIIGSRPPQFSEDVAWLPAWLQQHHVELLNEGTTEGQSSFEQRFEELPFLQHNISAEEYAILSSQDEGRYKSCHLFLSGEDNSPASLVASCGHVIQFHLHLSLDGNSESMRSQLLDTPQAEGFDSNHVLWMQQLDTSVIPEEKANQIEVDYNASVVNLYSSTYQQEKSENLGPQPLTTNKDKGMKHEEKVKFLKDADIDDAVELSVAASEALVIHELVKSESTTNFLPASAALEVALWVKQARLEALEETMYCLTEEVSETDFLSDLDESSMADAYEEVGVSVTVPGKPHPCGLIIRQAKDTLDLENYGSSDKLKHESLGSPEGDCCNLCARQQLEHVQDIDIQLKKDLASESFDGYRQRKLIDDSAQSLETLTGEFHVDPMFHLSVHPSPQVLTIELAESQLRHGRCRLSFQATVSPQAWSSRDAVRDDNLTNLVPERFQSRWLGGWTWKERQAPASVEHYSDRKILDFYGQRTKIPGFFVGETSFLSESADIAPGDNSFVQQQDNQSNVACQSSIPFEGLCNQASEGISVSEDVVRSSSVSFVDPLCSVVPCSISSENACPFHPLKHNDTVDARKCFNPARRDGMDSSAVGIGFAHGEGLAAHVTDGKGSQTTVRRNMTSLTTYSMLMPSHDTLFERKSIYSDLSFQFDSNTRLLSSVIQNPVTDLTNKKRRYDGTAKDEAEFPTYMQREWGSPLIQNHGRCCRFQASKCFAHDFSGEENLERSVVPESDAEVPMNLQNSHSNCKNLHDLHVPTRKRVSFLEAEINMPQNKLQKQQTAYVTYSTTRAGKKLRSFNPNSSRAQEVKRHLRKCCVKDGKRLIFQNIEFLLTGFSSQKENEIEGLVRKYGGIVLSDIPPPNSRRKKNTGSKCRPLPVVLCFKKLQSTKFLYGCAVNACMLTVNWLTDSIAVGSILPRNRYMVLPNHVGGKCTRIGKPVCHNNFIFDGVGIMLNGKHKFCSKMAKIVKHGGGLVFRTLQSLVQSLDSEKISLGAIVVENESRASRHLKHCASERKIPMMLASWIINSLHVGKLLPFMENKRSSYMPSIKLLDFKVSMEMSEEI